MTATPFSLPDFPEEALTMPKVTVRFHEAVWHTTEDDVEQVAELPI